MKVLVTGANGQVGRALQACVPGRVDLIPLDRLQLDVTDQLGVQRTIDEHQPDWIINTAAYTAVDKAEGDASAAQLLNTDAVSFLAEAAAGCGARLVQISTDFVFNGERKFSYKPTDRRDPLSVYGTTKMAGEDAAGKKALIVRTSWVYAAGHANFVTTMLRLMKERDELHVVSDQIGAPTYAGSLAKVIWELVEGGKQGVFHYCDAGEASWYDFAVAIQNEALAIGLLDRSIPIMPISSEEYPVPAKRPRFSRLDCSITSEVLGRGFPDWRDNLRVMLKQEQALG